jgi:hypothetical protein
MRLIRNTLLGCCITVLLPASVQAQPRASERSQVTQIVNGTIITLDYSRPVARGRDNLFGGVVHWGEMWTPGANWATTLEVDRDIDLNGHPVPAGKYSVWMQPGPEAWTVFLNSEVRLYHDSPVPEARHVLTFEVRPEEGAHMEALAWYFPVIGPRTATLHMHWGPTYVPLGIETRQFEAPGVSPERLAGYVGSYAVSGRDPTTGGPLDLTIQVLDEDGAIAGRWGRAPVALIPAGEHEFYFGFLRNGDLFDVGDEMTLRMVMDGDVATGVEMVWEGADVFARGERVR